MLNEVEVTTNLFNQLKIIYFDYNEKRRRNRIVHDLTDFTFTFFFDYYRKHPITLEIDNPEEVLSVLDNLMQNIVMGIEILSHSGPMVNEKR